MIKWFSELQLFRGFRASLPYIGYVAALLICSYIVLYPANVDPRLVVASKFIGVGASTALFTRFLGGMGLFKEAISDVLGEDKWLDRRNDLDDLWRRISRRIFLPGFVEKAEDPSAAQFLNALNQTMTQTILRSANTHHSYYSKDAKRTIVIRWKDKSKHQIEVSDKMNCDIVVFGKSDDAYAIRCIPTSGSEMNEYGLSLVEAKIDRQDVLSEIKATAVDGVHYMPLKAGTTHAISREMLMTQNVVRDPLYVISVGHVVWGMDVTIINDIPELLLNWEETGMRGVFEETKSEPRLAQLMTKKVLLPAQGIYIVLTAAPPNSPTTA